MNDSRQLIHVVCAGSVGVIWKEQQLLESAAQLCLVLYLERYGFRGYRLEAFLYRGSRRKLKHCVRNAKKRGNWIYAAEQKRGEFLLFTDYPDVFLSLKQMMRPLSALEVMMTADWRHGRQNAVKAVRMPAF